MSKDEPQTVPLPRDNPDLVGQTAAEQTLLAAHASGRLPHAWLFVGPRGIGKATLAYRFARFLLADEPADAGPSLFGDALPAAAADLAISLEHPVSRLITAGAHPDLKVLERGRDPKTGKLRAGIPVEEARGLAQFLHRTAGQGGWRVVIVDGAEEMNPNAANAILKVLEEPPRQTLLILVCHAPGQLLETLHSRCCRLTLAPLPDSEVAELLVQHAPELEENDRAVLARLGEGSIGRALDLSQSGGLLLYRELITLLADLPKLDVPGLHKLGDKVAGPQNPAAFRTVSGLLTWWLGRMIRGHAQGSLPPELVEGETALMARLLQRRGLAPWLTLWENLDRLFARTESANLDRKQVLITAFLEIEALAA